MVDLIGYRRHGHSEVDDPTTTQPVLYQKIEALSSLWKSYAETIGTDARKIDALVERIRREFEKEQEHAKTMKVAPTLREFPSYWSEYRGGSYDPSLEVDTGVTPELLREVSQRLTTVPENFHIHPKVKRGLDQRREMGRGERPVDWGMVEALAFGSLLWEGTQEEPTNMGALFFVQPRLQKVGGSRPIRSVKRSASATPATGSVKAHSLEQAALLALAFAGHERAQRPSGEAATHR